jgi:excisionase family DNA binding protein
MKADLRVVRCAGREASEEPLNAERLKGEIEAESGVLTREELAVVMKVSVRTLDRMVEAKEIPHMRLRDLVRFNLPDVVRHLTATAATRKHGRGAAVRREVEG